MARRSRDWNVGLAQDLKNAEFAREFLLAAIDEGVPIQFAMGKVIRAMGVKEFAAKVRMASPNVLRAINPRHNPSGRNAESTAEAVLSKAERGSDWRAQGPSRRLKQGPCHEGQFTKILFRRALERVPVQTSLTTANGRLRVASFLFRERLPPCRSSFSPLLR